MSKKSLFFLEFVLEFGDFIIEASILITDLFIQILRIFWVEEKQALRIIRNEHLKKSNLLIETSIWLSCFLINFLLIKILISTKITIVLLFLMIISLILFLYWLNLTMNYFKKKDIINPDQEI